MTPQFQIAPTYAINNLNNVLEAVNYGYPYIYDAPEHTIVGICASAYRVTSKRVALSNIEFLVKDIDQTMLRVSCVYTSHLHTDDILRAYDYLSNSSIKDEWSLPEKLNWPLFDDTVKNQRTLVITKACLAILDENINSNDESCITTNSLLHFTPFDASGHENMMHHKKTTALKHHLCHVYKSFIKFPEDIQSF